MARTLINVPARAKRGEIIEIKTLIAHIMETGFRRTETGELLPGYLPPGELLAELKLETASATAAR